MALARGLMSYVRTVVAEPDTMTAMGTGELPVLAIPRLLALAGQAAVEVIAPSLESGVTSVGAAAAMEYKLPSPIGAEVVVCAELTGVAGRRLSFSFIARQRQLSGPAEAEDRVVAAGTLERVLVDRDRFVSATSA